ncbi:MAG: phosphoribosylaminoimidazolesuccinocarboxamide synthase [Acidobacteriota bacterium]
MQSPRGQAITSQELPGIPKVNQGKVREIFGLEENLLIVATDRISAFDVILPNAIPHKGRVLTQLSAFWFSRLDSIVENHLISVKTEEFPASLDPFRESLEGRSMLVRKCEPLPIECVVRGYLAGSGWKEYLESETVCGIQLPSGLRESDELPEPVFTPATKATSGHDENISFDKAVELVGSEIAERVRELSLQIYNHGRSYAMERGIILGDTKFEFGLQGTELIWIDEALTPDSSRFWPADQYQPGQAQASFDKQFVRDYLETLDWDKKAPGPVLPEEVVEATSSRYLEAFSLLTGEPLDEGQS